MGACTIEIEYTCGNERRVRSNLSQNLPDKSSTGCDNKEDQCRWIGLQRINTNNAHPYAF